ncbi:hypothetical protein [Marinagarivorans cellulosilyticus]|uniref:Uncharacterized protein n=1 Tax=Marinagarivorans cellulosilyticus TaxID=2721545 RepID=A0AAN1WLF8_9GAMM|nr:hypothetical protein [Marinagarivorans cellulosilyticus]BCD99776.1 hypothetical protein MARGE09_P3978 [Marinagarivorans cellulosilyticus]
MKTLHNAIISAFLFGTLITMALPSMAHKQHSHHRSEQYRTQHRDYSNDREYSQHNIARERDALNEQRQVGHREFDALMRALDFENREIDRWQQRHHWHDHQHIARIANERRDALNRERDSINRQRDQMNRHFDQINRQLDRRAQEQHRHQSHNRRYY